MKKMISVLTACVIAATAVCIGTGLSAGAATTTVDVTYYQSAAREMLEDINELRTSEEEAWYWNSTSDEKIYCTDLEELVWDYDLEKAAMQRAAELVLNFGHYRPNGELCITAYTDLYKYYFGENIAMISWRSQSSANISDMINQFLELWKETDDDYDGQGHRRNMLSNDFSAVAVSCIYYDGYFYCVQLFSDTVNNTTYEEANDALTSVTVETSKDVETTTEPDTETTTETTTEPETEATTEPETEATTEPETETTTEPETETTTEPETETTTEPETEPATEPDEEETEVTEPSTDVEEETSEPATDEEESTTTAPEESTTGSAADETTTETPEPTTGAAAGDETVSADESTTLSNDAETTTVADADASENTSSEDADASTAAVVTETDIPDTGAETQSSVLGSVLGVLGVIALAAVMIIVQVKRKGNA